MILFLLSAFLILDFDSLRKRETVFTKQFIQVTIVVIFHKSQFSSSFSTNLNMLFIAASADNLAFFGGIIYLVSTKQIKKLII